MKNNNQIKLLRKIQSYLNPSPWINAINLSPAESMRRAADALDQKSKDLSDFDKFIEEFIND